ncbi:siderophore-iron reductase FhuF [Pseudomonas syringae]|uniref:Iron reductase n=1 Tax=Pseudomonas syringae TaxID=317 RepID=A0A085VFJ8_PSESX|nr:siderophore-iron reductase FhuF [Pseudomonas syringae]KFE54211.1 iron reductase [Pseudomonas syringae]
MTDTERLAGRTQSRASALLRSVDQRLFSGAFTPFGQTLLAAEDPQPVRPLLEVLRPESLDALLLNIYGPALMPAQRAVLVSQWSKYYFMQLIPPVVVASLVFDRHWSLALDRVSLALDARGLPSGVKLSDCERGSLGELLDDNLRPFIAALSAYGHVPGSVLWGNAGDYLESCLVRLNAVTDVSLEAGYGLLRNRTLSDGRRNPLFKAIDYVGEPARRKRLTCCLSYQVEWVGRCEHCPVQVAI